MRSKIKSNFEKNYFKLLNYYGKIMESLRKRINIKAAGSEYVFTNYAAKANFLSNKIINENVFSINRMKEQFVLSSIFM